MEVDEDQESVCSLEPDTPRVKEHLPVSYFALQRVCCASIILSVPT